jgi:hypothetical protein
MSRKQVMQEYGTKLIHELQVYLRALHTHQANNDIVKRTRNALHSTLREYFAREPQGSLQVQLLPEETFLNSTLLPIAMQDFGRIKDMTAQLRQMSAGELIFDANVTPESLSEFAQAVYGGLHSGEAIKPRVFKGLQVLELEYSSSGSSERDAHKVAVWLYAGLLDGLQGLRDLVSEGHVPTMVPFMRHMRLLVDLTAERGMVLRHLCLARPSADTDAEIQQAACRTVLAVQIAHANGLDRSSLMALGLSSILDVVTQGTHPSKVMAKLAPYTTLSDLAPSVMMTLRALELARLGKPSDSLGQLLLLTDDVVETIHGSEPATLEHVHSQLSWVQGAEPEMLKTVISWLGDTPVGAMATSKRLDKVLLYDHGEDGETLRCREIFEDGLGDVVLLRDLDKDEPIVFSGRFDFAFIAEDEEGW